MSPAVDEPMADVRDMYMAHTMLRREFRLLPELTRDVTPGDAQRAAVVAAHAELLCSVLHLHHEGEDLLLWPRLVQRAGEEAADIVPTMEEQHHAIDRIHTEVAKLLSPWRAAGEGGEELAEAFERLLSALLEHLELEEREILPLAQKYVTAAEWKQLGEYGLAHSPKKTLPLTFGMAMYEGDRDVLRSVLAEAPLPARLIMPVLAPRLYAAHAKRVHGTSTPPRVGTS